jgi:uncharacterized repeat protein (TIGR01451 family)
MKKQLLSLVLFLYALMALGQQAYEAPTLFQCQSIIFNLTVQDAVILGGQDPENFSVTYYTTEADAMSGVNSIINATAYGITGDSTQRIYARVSDNSTGSFATTSFDVIVGAGYQQPDISSCGAYILPQLPVGLEYYTSPNASGPSMFAGTRITTTMTLYVYGNSEGCITEAPFTVTILPTPPSMQNVTACGGYTLPQVSGITFYTQPNGEGTMIAAGTAITQTVTLYPYNGFCNGNPYTITVLPTGTITDEPRTLSACEIPGMEGTASFDLNVISEQIIDDYPSFIQLYYFTTLADAENYVNPITNIEAYQNIIPYNQTLYVMLDVFCGFRIIPIELEVLSCNEGVLGLAGTIKLDENSNGCDATDTPLSGVLVGYNIGNYVQYTYTDAAGNYSFYGLPEGEGNVWVQNVNGQNFLAMPTSLLIAYAGTLLQQDFCITAPQPVLDVASVLTPTSNARPGFVVHYYVAAFNAGTATSASGSLSLTYDNTLLSLANAGGGVATGNTLTWTYTDLLPQSQTGRWVSFNVATPPTANSGTILPLTLTVTPAETDSDTTNNTYMLNHIVVNSFDPNDIMVKEGDFISPQQAEEDFLHYTVRFQNTGTANADRVRITLPLDANLNINTFQPVSASHAYRVYRDETGVTFVFNEIDLPYESANERGSHGFVTFRIRPALGISSGESISETASIYFDFNSAIVTNTAVTTVREVASVAGVNKAAFSLVPNPASSSVRIAMAQSIDNAATVTVTDVLGKKLINEPLATDGIINISNLSKGVYMVSLTNGATITTQKLIVK